jgi:hypothetical protein
MVSGVLVLNGEAFGGVCEAEVEVELIVVAIGVVLLAAPSERFQNGATKRILNRLLFVLVVLAAETVLVPEVIVVVVTFDPVFDGWWK